MDTNKFNTWFSENVCVLPPVPENGLYVVTYRNGSIVQAVPGQRANDFKLTVSCKPGFDLVGAVNVSCLGGWWSDVMSECLPICKVEKQTSVVTCEASVSRCVIDQSILSSGPRPGSEKLECGVIDPDFLHIVIGGQIAKGDELPWHTGIYSKKTVPFMQICGGSIVSRNVVISAAHCFWNDLKKQLPAADYAVGAGKRYRPWSDDHDKHAQKLDVKEIKIPPLFHGSVTNFQEDIAVVIVTSDFTFNSHVKPVCLDFNYQLDAKQLQDGKLGMTGGWGLTTENGQASPLLKVVEMPVVSIERCIAESPHEFRNFITGDKFCAGFTNGSALCRGDSGGGLAFPENINGIDRYFLRGIISTAPRNDNLCNAFTWATFTHVIRHENFIKSVFGDIMTQSGYTRPGFGSYD